jgi:hypothetical protein
VAMVIVEKLNAVAAKMKKKVENERTQINFAPRSNQKENKNSRFAIYILETKRPQK